MVYIGWYSKSFLHAGNHPVVLKNSTEHAEALFIALVETSVLDKFYI